MNRIWIDVDVLFTSPSLEACSEDVRRFLVEVCQALQACAPDRIGFVHRKGGPQDWISVNWTDVKDLPVVTQYRAGALHVIGRQSEAKKHSKARNGAAPPHVAGIADVLRTQFQVLRAASGWFGAAARYGVQQWQENLARRSILSKNDGATGKSRHSALLNGAPLKDLARPGDFFLALGPSWNRPDYSQTIRWLRDVMRVQFGLFVHDLQPVRYPEWFTKATNTHYEAWHRTVLPLVDQVFVRSDAVAEEVTGYLAHIKRPLLRPIVTVPVGSRSAPTGGNLSRQAARKIPLKENYVLCVGTLEPRRNHELLLRVWRHLQKGMAEDSLPKLVFVGQVGWLVSDLMQQLENSDWLNGQVLLVSAPSDAQRDALYRNCLFTVDPSLAGDLSLPALESLQYGKPCLASKPPVERTNDQGLVRYFDPLNLHDAARVIGKAIEDRDELKCWADEIERRFKPVFWQQSAQTILRHTL